jgi:hypothetical protein
MIVSPSARERRKKIAVICDRVGFRIGVAGCYFGIYLELGVISALVFVIRWR